MKWEEKVVQRTKVQIIGYFRVIEQTKANSSHYVLTKGIQSLFDLNNITHYQQKLFCKFHVTM